MSKVPWILFALALVGVIWLLIQKNKSDRQKFKAQTTVKAQVIEVDKSEAKYLNMLDKWNRESFIADSLLKEAKAENTILASKVVFERSKSQEIIDRYRTATIDQPFVPKENCDTLAEIAETWMEISNFQALIYSKMSEGYEKRINAQDSVIQTQDLMYAALRRSFDIVANNPTTPPSPSKKNKRWVIGPMAGYGLTNNKPSPFAGIGITYSLFKF